MLLEKRILHVDMDAFFASVEILDNPKLKGKPIIVGGEGGRGVVTTCSYEARKYGVKSAMPGFKAKALCPDGIFVPIRHYRYREISNNVFKLLYDITEKIEQVSIDEAYLDISDLEESAMDVAMRIKDLIKNKIGLTLSVGISYNKFLAKIASDWEKPDGLMEIKKENVKTLLGPLEISKVYGLGKKSVKKLNNIGIYTINDMYELPRDIYSEYFGKFGNEIYDRIRGIDNREVINKRERKSIGKEITLKEDTKNVEELSHYLMDFSTYIEDYLKKHGLKAKTITLKINESLTNKDILVIAPNKIFLDYISEVLPNLGVDLVPQKTFEELAIESLKLKGKLITKDKKLIKILEADEEDQEKIKFMKNTSKLKGSLAFKEILDRYIKVLEKDDSSIEDITIKGYKLFDSKEIKRLFLKDLVKYPINKRKDEIKRYFEKKLGDKLFDVLEKVDFKYEYVIARVKKTIEDEKERRKEIIRIYDERDKEKESIKKDGKKEFNSYFEQWKGIDTKNIYINLFKDTETFNLVTSGKVPSKLYEFIKDELIYNNENNIIDCDDLAAMLYLQYKIDGIKESEMVKHIVVDEAQDYSPLQIEVILDEDTENEKKYILLSPLEAEEKEEVDMFIFRVDNNENGEEYNLVENDEEFNKVKKNIKN